MFNNYQKYISNVNFKLFDTLFHTIRVLIRMIYFIPFQIRVIIKKIYCTKGCYFLSRYFTSQGLTTFCTLPFSYDRTSDPSVLLIRLDF